MVLSKKDEIFGQDQCAKGVDLGLRGFTRSGSWREALKLDSCVDFAVVMAVKWSRQQIVRSKQIILLGNYA